MKQIAPWKVESKTLFRLSGAMNLCRADCMCWHMITQRLAQAYLDIRGIRLWSNTNNCSIR